MDSLHGTWLNETSYEGTKAQTYQVIQPDGSYETRMYYIMPDGCQQTIRHKGSYNVQDDMLTLSLEAGTTIMSGCPDDASNFTERPFTEAELAETTAMLSQTIQVEVNGDILTTILQGPAGEMRVMYQRQA